VLDKFHVLQHAAAALDEVRRQEFFRAGAVMRRFGRGKRWLLLRRWNTVRGSKRQELRALFAANRRLFKAYVLRGDHAVRFGVVESLNTTIKGVIRRTRGMRDEKMLLLKLKWAAARPIRSALDAARFLESI
jgi:transposase